MLEPKLALAAVILGILVSFVTGLIPNKSIVSVPEVKLYGYPFFWLITDLDGSVNYVIISLIIDMIFWIIISFFVLFITKKMCNRLDLVPAFKNLLLPIILFIPLGLLMNIIHEVGHVFWGTLVGGKLTYMQIAYFIIYPRLAVTLEFRLGAVKIGGLAYGSFAYGLMLLGGSMTTNIASWIIAILLYKIKLSNRVQVALKVFGLFGILDLPFYIIFPQMGLSHWIFLGGRTAEPLIGIRMMGISDFALYLATAISTLGLLFLYFKLLDEKFNKKLNLFNLAFLIFHKLFNSRKESLKEDH